jgi:hypothetical protein
MNDNFFVPTRDYIANLKVGDRLTNALGHDAHVTGIHARKDDINGKLFVCFYAANTRGFVMSDSLKEGTLQRTLPLMQKYRSVELDAIERNLQA